MLENVNLKHGVVLIKLFMLGMYLIVITKKQKVGDLLGHAVWKALDFDIISYKKTILHLRDSQVISGLWLDPWQVQTFQKKIMS